MSLHPEIRRRSRRLGALKHHIAPLLISSGAVILGFVGVQYGAMMVEQHRLQTLWQEQQEREKRADHRQSVAFRESSLARLTIPAIGFSAVVVEGTDALSLILGPGHMTGTALPGDAGNSVISAHRDTFFRKITNLGRGDHILVERDGRTFTYSVDEFKIVKPDDVSVAAPSKDDRLTLVTCDPAYYAGLAPQRLVIVSRLIGGQPKNSIPAVTRTQPRHKQSHIRTALARNRQNTTQAQ